MSSQFNSNSSASFGIGISNYNTSNNGLVNNNFLSGSSGCFSSAGSAAFNQFAAAGGCGGGPNFGPTPSGNGPTPNTTNIILQTLKRRANKNFVPLDERVTLERALGFTITSNTRLTQSSDGLIAYLAGCVIVLYDPTRQTQEFILSSARKTLTTVAFSHDGKLIATGESGHDPKVRVWDVREKTQVCEFGGHKFSIECVCFSTNPSSNLLVSIGSMHDMVVNVWNTRTRFKVASNKIACKVKGIAFARDGAYFVTVGNRHVKFWYLTTSSLMETVPLKGRAAILNEYKNSHFCDVVCGAGECAHYTYALTTNGLICEFEHESRSLRAVVELHTERAYCIYADLYNLFVGCANGAIHIYRQKSLDLIASLPRPHSLGVDVARFVDTRQLSSALAPHHADIAKYPDCVALCYNAFTLSAIYNDHSFYVWDIRDLSKVKKIDSHLFHSSCCFAVDTFNPSWQPPGSYSIPVDSFITSSSDNTLRIWSPVTTSSSSYSPDSSTSSSSSSSSNNRLKTNIYSKQLLKVIYIDNDLSALCDQTAILASSADNSDSQSTLSTNGSNTNGQTSSSSNTIANTNLPISNITNFSSSDSNSLAPKLGARCLKINPFGNQLATGDRNGNIRIYDLTSPVGASGTLSSKAICMIEAHDGEILYLQYSQPESGRLLLASSSRDRLIHIFDASKLSYDLLQTLDDHSAAIMSVRFYFNSFERQLYVISCGADKSIMIRTTASPESQEFARQSYVVEKQTFHDLIVDESKSCINTISQDRMVRQYSIRDGKKLRQFKGSLNEDGYLLKMDMARNGSLLATSCTDKCVYVYDVNTGECVAYIYGHSEVVLDLKFTSDSQRLITVGGDGCIFIWKLSSLITQIANNTATSTSLSNSASVSQPVVSSTTTTSSRRPVIHTILSAPKQHPVNATLTISQQAAAQGQVPSPTPAVVVGGSASNSLVDSIFDADGLPEWARARISSFNQLSTTSRASTNQSSWSSSTNNSTYIDNTLSEYTSSSNYCQNQQQSQSQQQQPQTQQDSKQQRRSRAVWGPPAQNTSFAIMLENESMLSNAGNNTSAVNNANTSLSFATDLNNKEDEDDEDNGAATSSEADDEVDESPAQTSGDIDETIITTTTGSVPFPSPRVDSDFTYPHSKQAKLNENVGSEKQQRFTWTQSIEDENRCCDDEGEKHEDDGDETNKRQPIPSSTSSATTSSTDSIEEEEELIIVETTTTTTTTTRDVVANQEDEDQEPASSSSSSKSPPPRLFSPNKQQQQQQDGVSQQPESSALSSPGDDEFHSPSSEIRSLTDKFYGSSENSETNNQTSSQTNLIDSIIKLNSDIESTIRRQSISARYLMKTQQQKQQQQHLQAGTPIVGLETGSQSQMRRENECGATSPVSSSSSSVSSSSSCLNETSSGKVTIRKIEDISGVINQALNNAAETNLEGHQKPIIEPRKSPTNSSSSTSSSSSIQMAASELMKMRRRSALLMGVPNSSSSSVSIPSHLATTESSLNKIKTKSTISAAQSSVGSGHLKRSPSASSLVATNEAAAAKSKDRTSVVNNKNISSSAKSSPTKCAPANSSQVNNSQEASESGAGDGETQNGMKKAVSMISLMSNQPSVSSTSSTSSTSSSSSSTMTKTMPKSTSSSKPPLSSTSTMSSSSSSSTTLVNNANNAAGNMLPPKTVRQIKQRSAERQMTSSGLLTTSTTSTTGAAASSSAFSRNSSINTFNEQNKHIRKLSSSIQNLHNQQQQQQQQQVPKDSNLPPQAPNRASSKSPQLHSSPSKQTKSSQQQQSGLGISHKAKSSSYRALTTITKPNPINPPPQPQQQKQQQQQQSEEEEPKREVVEITPEQPVEESQTSSEVPNNAVTNPYQNSSNSLTSSSSSSCSIFDSNLASGTSNPLDVDLVGSSASKCGGDGGYRSASTTPNTCSSASSSTSTATTAILNTAATTVATASSGPFKKPVTFASLASHHAANALNLANSSSSGVSNRVGSHSASSMCDSTTNVGNLIGGSGSSSSASPSPVHFHQEMADRIRCEFKQNFYHFHKQMLDESGKYSEQNTPTNDSSHHQYHRPYHLAGAVAAAANQTLTPLQALQFMHTFNTIYASTSQHNNNRQQLKSSDLLVESTTSKETVDDEAEIEMTA